MAERRARTRSRPDTDDDTPARGSRPDKGKTDTRRTAGVFGAQGMAMAKAASEKAQARRDMTQYGPPRMWLEDGDEDVEVIVLEKSTGDIFWQNEHEMWNGKGRDYVTCVKDLPDAPPCVLCAEAERQARDRESKFRHSYTAMFLSVVDTRSYKTKEGKKVPFSKRVLFVKQSSAPKFWKILQAAEKQHGTIRGCSILLSRSGEKAPRHGEPTIDEDTGTLYQMVSEKDLRKDFGTDPVTKEGKVIRAKDFEITAYDFAAIFKEPDQAAIAQIYDLKPPAGSKADLEQEWEEDGEDKPRRGRGQRVATRGKEVAEDEPPARGRRGRAAVEEEPEDDDEVEDGDEGDEPDADDPPPRGRGRSRREEPEDEPEDEPEEEPAPRRGRSRGRPEPEPEPARGRGRGKPAGRARARGEDLDDEVPF